MQIKLDFKSLDDFDRETASLRTQSKTKMKEAAGRIRDKMRAFIKPSRRGSTGKLARAITVKKVETKQDEIIYVIGDMPELFRKVPYWFVANYGRLFPGSYDAAAEGKTGKKFIPPPTMGAFAGNPPRASASGTGKGKDRFRYNSNGSFIEPTHSTKPLRFIEKTNDWLVTFWDNFWSQAVR